MSEGFFAGSMTVKCHIISITALFQLLLAMFLPILIGAGMLLGPTLEEHKRQLTNHKARCS